MRLGVVAALSNELGPTLKRLRPASRPHQHLRFHESPPFVFAAGGVGARPAAAAALLMVDAFKPDALLSVGFCGALTDDLKAGDLILGGTTGFPATPELETLARSAFAAARAGETAMAEKVLVDADAKRALFKETGALAVDMESKAVALAARKHGLGFLCVKVVIDTPSDPLASTYSGCGSVLWELLKNPGMVASLWYDGTRVRAAAEKLAQFFAALKEKVPA